MQFLSTLLVRNALGKISRLTQNFPTTTNQLVFSILLKRRRLENVFQNWSGYLWTQ